MKKVVKITFAYAMILAIVAAIFTILNNVLYTCFVMANKGITHSSLTATLGKLVCAGAVLAITIFFIGLIYSLAGMGTTALGGGGKGLLKMMNPKHISGGTADLAGRMTDRAGRSVSSAAKSLGWNNMKKLATDATRADSSDLLKGSAAASLFGAKGLSKGLRKAAGAKYMQEAIFGTNLEDSKPNTGEAEKPEEKEEETSGVSQNKEATPTKKRFMDRFRRRKKQDQDEEAPVVTPRTKSDRDEEETATVQPTSAHEDENINPDAAVIKRYNENHKPQHDAEQAEGIETTAEPDLDVFATFFNVYNLGKADGLTAEGIPFRDLYDDNGILKEEYEGKGYPESLREAAEMHGVNYSEVQRIFANVDKEKGETLVSEDSEEAPETDENVAKNSAKERQKKGADTAANQPGQPVGSTPKDVNKQREKRAQDQARVWTMADGSEARDVIESVVRTGERFAIGEDMFGATIPSAALIPDHERIEDDDMTELALNSISQYADGLNDTNINKEHTQEEVEALREKRKEFLDGIKDQHGNSVGDQIAEVVGEGTFEESELYPVLMPNAEGGFNAVTDDDGNVIFRNANEQNPQNLTAPSTKTNEEAAKDMVGGAISENDEQQKTDETSSTETKTEDQKDQDQGKNEDQTQQQFDASDFTAGKRKAAEPEAEVIHRNARAEQKNTKSMDIGSQPEPGENVQDEPVSSREAAEPSSRSKKSYDEQQAQNAADMFDAARLSGGSEQGTSKFETPLFRMLEKLELPGRPVIYQNSSNRISTNDSDRYVNIHPHSIERLMKAMKNNNIGNLDSASGMIARDIAGDGASDSVIRDFSDKISRAITEAYSAQKERDERETINAEFEKDGNDGKASSNKKKNIKFDGRTKRIEE